MCIRDSNCASLGCPNLQQQAFSADNTEQLLESAAISFINSNKGAQVEGNKLVVSSIYDWFGKDFAIDGGVRAHIEKYRPSLTNAPDSIDYEYNWSLNEKR